MPDKNRVLAEIFGWHSRKSRRGWGYCLHRPDMDRYVAFSANEEALWKSAPDYLHDPAANAEAWAQVMGDARWPERASYLLNLNGRDWRYYAAIDCGKQTFMCWDDTELAARVSCMIAALEWLGAQGEGEK